MDYTKWFEVAFPGRIVAWPEKDNTPGCPLGHRRWVEEIGSFFEPEEGLFLPSDKVSVSVPATILCLRDADFSRTYIVSVEVGSRLTEAISSIGQLEHVVLQLLKEE